MGDTIENLIDAETWDGTEYLTIARPTQYIWSPQPDITAHELALALPVLVSADEWNLQSLIETLPVEVQRHFVRLPSE